MKPQHLIHKVREYLQYLYKIGAVKIYVAVEQGEALRQKERQDETHSVYHQNWWKIQFGSQLFRSVKFSLLPSYMIDALLCRNWSFSVPLIVGTSWINSIMLSKQVRLDMKQEGHMDLNEYVNIFTRKFLVIILLHISSTFNSQFLSNCF